MVDLGAIQSAFVSLKTASEILLTIKGLNDSQMIQSKVIDLQAQIVAAQQSALTAQSEQMELVQRIREFELAIADADAWRQKAKGYQLTDVGNGVMAYAVEADNASASPMHMMCAKCFEDKRLSILQPTMRAEMRRRVYKCFSCDAEHAFSPYDPFRSAGY